jgi:CRP/FNR family cyclic AMP-dependent transcriptional regulator
LRVTAARLDGMTQYLVDVKQQYADRDDHLGMVDGILDVLVHHHPKQAQTGSARDPEAG